MSDTYTDPNEDDMKRVFEILKMCDSYTKVIDTVRDVFPNWIVSTGVKYCRDYPHLQKNWEIMCTKTQTEPKIILRVDNITFDTKHVLLHLFCERLTRDGCVIRHKNDLVHCTRCNALIPSKEMYLQLKTAPQLKIPHTWKNKCVVCSSSN